MLSDIRYRLRALFRSAVVEREMDEELRFHLEREIDKRIASGMTREEAVRQAALGFGGIDQTREACRDACGVAFVETILQDIRYGLRTMKRSPIFSLTAVATIALASAALATVFTLGYTLLFRRLPVYRPGELVSVAATRRPSVPDGVPLTDAARFQILGPVSYLDYLAFRDRTTTLAGLATHYPTAPLFVTANGDAREVNGAVVSSNFFSLLGLQPALGRFFHDEEDRVPDRDRVAVLGHEFWRTWFGSSRSAIGASIRINGSDFTIVGVAPPTFAGMTTNPISVYIPMMMLRVGYRWCADALAADCTILQMIGRLAPGRALADAAAELPTLMPGEWAHAPPGENSGVAVVEPRGVNADTAEVRLIGMLAGVAIVLLLVCCANLAGLLIAQSAARAREFGVRLALGASSARIVRQLVSESMMIALAGGAAGVVLSRPFVQTLGAMFYSVDVEGHPQYYGFGIRPEITLGTIGAAAAAGALFGIVAALATVRRRDLDLRSRAATARRSVGGWLIGTQAAVAVALVVVAGLLGSSARVMLAGAGYDTSHVALMRLRPRLAKYPPARAQQFQRDVVRRLEATAGVESVSLVGIGIVLSGARTGVALPGEGDSRLTAGYNEIGPRYFATLRTPLAAGREFDERDNLAAPRVAIVNETLVRRLWPGGGAMGATIVVGTEVHQVVGVVSDVTLKSRTEPVEPFVYTPFWQNPAQIDSRLCIRVAGDPAATLPMLVREVNRVDPDVPIAETITLQTQMRGLFRPVRVGATFVGFAAALAVLLTAVGLYGALAFSVARRTKEIGIRMALGAARGRMLATVVREGMMVVAIGVGAGLGLAVAASRLARHLLYGSADADWVIYLSAAGAIALVGFVATLLPARRAAAVEPLVALRCE